MTRPRTVVVLSDAQIPYQNQRALSHLYEFIKDYQPEMIASVGDDVDFPQVSRWNRGMEGEYARSLQDHVDAGIEHFTALRSVARDAPIHVMRSNHMDRPLNYIRKNAPGLLGLKALEVPSLLNFDELGITYHEQPWELVDDWVLAHGDEGSLSRTAGGTAMGLARKWGKSVVCGHTHRLGLMHDHSALNFRITQRRYGFEVGHLMDLAQADYLKSGYANWNPGFGILYVTSKGVVTPVPILVEDNGSFLVEGVNYAY